MQFEEYALKLNVQMTLQAEQRRKQSHKKEILPAHQQELYLWVKELGLIEPQKYSLSDHPVSKQLSTLLRHGSCIVIIGLTKSGRKAWQEEEETRKDTSIALIHQE